MNKKLILKLTLDIVMTLLMIVLMGFEVSGSFIHEIIGVAVLLMIIIHNLLNIKWFVSVFKSKQKNYKSKLKVIINALLTVNSIFLLISSLIISQHLFLFLGITELGNWAYIHRLTSYLEIVMISIHLGFHWKMVMGAFRKMFKIKNKDGLRTFILRATAIVLAIVGIKASFDRNIATSLLPDDTGNSGSSIEALSIQSTAVDTVSSTKDNYSYNGVTVSEGDTLNDFLGNIVCTACGRHCSLLRPKCSKGDRQVTEATAIYEEYTAAEALEETTTEKVITEDVTTEDTTKETTDLDTSYQSSTSDKINSTISIEVDSETDDSLLNLFTDYIPIMGLYVAGVYYAIEIIDKSKK